MDEHLNPTILGNFENNCENMDIKRTNSQTIIRDGVENTNLQFMNIHSRDQEFIDHTLLGPEYIANSFMIDLMDEEQHDASVQTSSDCSIATLGSHESFPSEAQMNSILQFVNRQGHIRNQPNINVAESTNDHLLHHNDKEIIDSEFLAMHGNLLNEQNLKLFCSHPIIPTQESISTDLNVPQLHQSLSSAAPSLTVTQSSWHKKENYHQDILKESAGDILGHLGTTARKVLPHKKRISKKLKNLDRPEITNTFDLAVNAESTASTASRVTNPFASSSGLRYECELCGSISESQVQFFSHLKGHYEPSSIVESIESPIATMPPTSSLTVAVDMPEPTIKESDSPLGDVVQQDHAVFNEVELNFESFNEVVEQNSTPIPVDMKMLDSNSIEKCMQYVAQAQGPNHQVHHIHSEEVEFSDAEDMLEGIRGVVDKVSIDDASNDIDIRPRDICKETWFGNNGAFTFKKEIINSESFERQTAQLQQVSNQETDEDRKSPLNSIDFSDDHLNDHSQQCGDSFVEQNFPTKDVQEKSSKTNVKRRGRPKGITPKRKASKTSNDETASDEYVENKKKRYICTKCNREFNSCNALKYHNLSHTGERPHQCDICGKSFFAQSALKAHFRMHTGDKPYECEACHRKFRQWSDLKYHIASIHSDEKNYTCEFCGKSFSRKYSLVIHRRIHTSEKNYKCEFCPKSFRASSYLQNHRKIHTGEKPYTCETCGKKFRVCGDLRRHSRIHERKGANGSKSQELVDEVLPEQSQNSSINKNVDKIDNIKTDVLFKIEYQKESKDDLLFLDKMANKIEHLFKTEDDFVNEDLGSSDLSFVT